MKWCTGTIARLIQMVLCHLRDYTNITSVVPEASTVLGSLRNYKK